ncbi:MAG: efflux RND transporter periplasmic adaptor subunit [Deltaproteobacteria bacterium]|nr:efflux RND transporter periplasmic adaptor subunit [Deltaproteobacteria bacterium]
MRRFLLAALLAGCGPKSGGTGPAAVEYAVTRGDITPQVLLSGEMDAVDSEALVAPQTPTWSLSISWMEEDGVPVKAGQKVMEFDSSALGTRLVEQRLQASQAASELDRTLADNAVDLAGKRFEVARQGLMLEKAQVRAAVPEDSLARREWQERQLELARVTSALSAAQESLATAEESARLAIDVRQIAMDKTVREIETGERAFESLTLRAPRDGLMLVADHPWMGRKLDVGDETWPGTTMLRLPDLTRMQVKATLPDVDDGRIAEGMKATCVLDAWPDRTFAGTVASLAPVASKVSRDSLRRNFAVIIELDEHDAEVMLPGMSVRVEVEGRAVNDVLLAPRAALDLGGEVPRARKANGSWVEVQVGICDAQVCEVLQGLADGDRLRDRRGA